mmetsp:Transcript_40743/g.91823  ORF Transcript_40743/g.91823 Transcript_40743/m.91823 type:complete len:313 (-) Transcript_40743:1420-2358(-)
MQTPDKLDLLRIATHGELRGDNFKSANHVHPTVTDLVRLRALLEMGYADHHEPQGGHRPESHQEELGLVEEIEQRTTEELLQQLGLRNSRHAPLVQLGLRHAPAFHGAATHASPTAPRSAATAPFTTEAPVPHWIQDPLVHHNCGGEEGDAPQIVKQHNESSKDTEIIHHLNGRQSANAERSTGCQSGHQHGTESTAIRPRKPSQKAIVGLIDGRLTGLPSNYICRHHHDRVLAIAANHPDFLSYFGNSIVRPRERLLLLGDIELHHLRLFPSIQQDEDIVSADAHDQKNDQDLQRRDLMAHGTAPHEESDR